MQTHFTVRIYNTQNSGIEAITAYELEGDNSESSEYVILGATIYGNSIFCTLTIPLL
jgi:hypothetical protein